MGYVERNTQRLRLVGVLVFIIFLILLTPSRYSSDLHTTISSLTTSRLRTPQARVQIVSAHYGPSVGTLGPWLDTIREIPRIQSLGLKYTIYTKDDTTDMIELQELSGADEVILLPNIGRETETYLRHILDNYDNLPDYTFFTQSEPRLTYKSNTEIDDEQRDYLRAHFAAPGLEFVNLGDIDEGEQQHCDCGICLSGFYPLLPQLYTIVTGKLCLTAPGSPGQVAHINAQFIVSRDRIRAHPRWIYTYLHQLISAPANHLLHKQTKPALPLDMFLNGVSTPDNPLLGHTFERFWPVLFGCEDLDNKGCLITFAQAEHLAQQDPELTFDIDDHGDIDERVAPLHQETEFDSGVRSSRSRVRRRMVSPFSPFPHNTSSFDARIA